MKIKCLVLGLIVLIMTSCLSSPEPFPIEMSENSTLVYGVLRYNHPQVRTYGIQVKKIDDFSEWSFLNGLGDGIFVCAGLSPGTYFIEVYRYEIDSKSTTGSRP
ncbi:MAG: hypothetical protein PF447_15105 [Spirochaetaceae bacterium]|jgi:hypothetical protein|nr:hypothetical protein [Spirochaetaceae bacterium]